MGEISDSISIQSFLSIDEFPISFSNIDFLYILYLYYLNIKKPLSLTIEIVILIGISLKLTEYRSKRFDIVFGIVVNCKE